MPFMFDFTTDQWVTIAIIFAIGWVLGMLSRSGSGKYRKQYEDERDAHQTLRRDYDAHMAQHRAAPAATAQTTTVAATPDYPQRVEIDGRAVGAKQGDGLVDPNRVRNA